MGKRTLTGALICALFLFLGVVGFAQESAVKGNLGGTVVDSTGAVIPGAKVTLTGAKGATTASSDDAGNFMFTRLDPGRYSVKVEKKGFKTADAKGIEVAIGRTASLRMQMAPGAATETIEVTANAVTVDTTSTASGADLSDSFYASVPVPRNVSGLFYVAPGVADGGGTGRANPSISGGSGLENMYVADGVNITDAAFGGLGIFTRIYGSVGSGINLSFIKEVQVKTGGFEPQYGQATGGVVQLVTKSGGDTYHGALEGYFAPTAAQAAHPSIDDLRNRKIGSDLLTSGGPATGLGVGPGSYDVNAEVGGYVPGFRKSLFFFGSYNPTLNTDYSLPPQFAGSPLIQPVRVPVGLFTLQNGKAIYTRAWTNSYAGKLTYKINETNAFETSVFGDPTTTNNSAFRVVNAQNRSVFSSQKYQTRNFVGRYNGTLSPTWLVNASVTWNHNDFTETPQSDVFNVNNATTSGLSQTLQGLGLLENHNTDNYAYTIDTSKSFRFGGEHTFSIGFNNQFLNYDDIKGRTGGRFAVPDLGALNSAIYGCTTPTGDPSCPLGFMMNAQFTLRQAPASCTLCPLMTPLDGSAQIPVVLATSRAEYGPAAVQTEGLGYAAYVNDTWKINKYVSLSLGLRGEQYRMKGTAIHYTFTDNWAPRLGFVVDPKGDRKSKIYANFGRYNYQMPLDAAIRSLSNELDLGGLRFAPASTGGVVDVNPDGSINVLTDAAHVLNGQTGGTGGGVGVSFQSTTGFATGTKMQFEDEWIAGYERDFGHGIVFSARYLDRRLRRIVEDMSGISPEAFNEGDFNQVYLIGNPNSRTDVFTNMQPPQAQQAGDPCAGVANSTNLLGQPYFNNSQACFTDFSGGDPVADGLPDGFADPVRNYQAVEIEANKSFSSGWLMRANYRIARLQGNYEGAFRNDNNQTDPSISSLFDFTPGVLGLLGDQFAIGPLNTDRRHVVNGFFSYTFDRSTLKGLTLGSGIRVQGGTPISELGDHPAYLNAGEVPFGGRGKLGRTPVTGQVDLHSEYARKLTERYTFHLSADLFNVSDSQPITRIDQTRDLSLQGPFSNTDFKSITGYQNPFYARFALKVQF